MLFFSIDYIHFISFCRWFALSRIYSVFIAQKIVNNTDISIKPLWCRSFFTPILFTSLLTPILCFYREKADNLWPSKFWITSLILFNVAGWIEPFIWIVRNGTGHFLLQHRIILNFFAVFSLWTTWFFCWTFWCLRKKNWCKIPRKKSVNFISTLLIIVQKCSSISAMRNDLMLRAIFDCVINIA